MEVLELLEMNQDKEIIVKDNLLNQWIKQEKIPFKGWDFSHLKNRLIEENTPWNYISIAKRLIKQSKSMLDMGTGGGEILSKLGPFPSSTKAIEGYKQNIPVARKRLEPLGIEVIEANEISNLPFKDMEFDLVLNRHDAFNANEVFRILKTRGIFFTQQVGGDDLHDLTSLFNTKRKFADISLKKYKNELLKAGFIVKEAKEWEGNIEFKDIGAIVYYLKAIPWIVDNFSVKDCLFQLKKLQESLDSGKKLIFTQSRFYILAVKQI